MNNMRLRFLAKSFTSKDYALVGSMINGIDFSSFVEGSVFEGNEDTLNAGIYDAEWVGNELRITLGQRVKTTDVAWGARDSGWINAADYDPQSRYVHATNQHAIEMLESGRAAYWRDPETGAWTVRITEEPSFSPVEQGSDE